MSRELLEKALSRPIRDPTTRQRLLQQLARSFQEGAGASVDGGYRAAIEHYREALAGAEPGTPDRDQKASNLAELLRQLAELHAGSAWVGEDALLREAIDLYREALELTAKGTFEWFRTAANLAETIVLYPARSEAELHKARELLTIWHQEWPDPDPVDRAAVLDLLGAICLELPGDRAFNCEEAIRWLEAADAALEGEPSAGSGRNRAIVLSRLARAYQERPAGDPEENRETAARCFAKAAEVCPPGLHLEEHVAALRGLARVVAGSTDLAQVRQGIRHMASVLDYDRGRVPGPALARDLGGQANLHLRAHALGSREHLRKALDLFEEALAVPGVAASRALEASLLTDYGAAAIEVRPFPDGAEEGLRRAVELADTLEGDAPLAARARYHLGRLLAARGEAKKALPLYAEATGELEKGTEPGHSAESLAELGRRAGAIYEAAIDALLQGGGDAAGASGGLLALDEETVARALDLLERNKARSLGVGVGQRGLGLGERVPEELRSAFRDLRDERRFTETRLRMNRFGRAPAWQQREDARQRYGVDAVIRGQDVEVPYLEKRLGEIVAEEAKLVEEIRALEPGFDPAPRWPRLSPSSLTALLPEGRAILELVTTDRATYAFVLTAGRGETPALRVFAAPRLGARALSELVETEWLEPYRRYRAASDADLDEARENWERAVAGIGSRLGELLGFGEILDTLRDEKAREVVLVPYRALHRLPLHLLPGRGGGYLCDEMVVSYAPSLHVLSRSTRPGPVGPGSALLVEDPDGSLVFGALEVALARRFLEDPAVLAGADCRGDAVKAAMKSAEIFHYCGHASFEQRNPLLSGLKLADRRLTVAEIMAAADLSRCSLAVLSGCETAQVALTPSADEYTGLPGAFLLAGAPTVVGTQWVLDDGAGPLFADELYRNLIELEAPPAVAFGAALARLRSITADEVLARFEEPGEIEGDPGLERLLLAARYRSDRSRPMFEAPRYWAAYTLVGVP